MTPKICLDRTVTHYDILLEIHFQISPHPHNLFQLRSILMLSFHLHLCLSSSLFLSGYTTSNLYAFLLHPTPATRCALIAPPPAALDLMISVTFWKECRLWSSPLRNVFQSPVLDKNVLLVHLTDSVLCTPLNLLIRVSLALLRSPEISALTGHNDILLNTIIWGYHVCRSSPRQGKVL